MLGKLRQLTYQRGLVKLADRLGMRRLLAKVYCFCVAPRGVLRVRIGRHTYRFYARRPEELRSLEGPIIAQSVNSAERETLDLLEGFLRAGDVVYDVGANVGLYSNLMGTLVGNQGKVVAFEPDARSYRRLEENLALNGLSNVMAFRLALGETSSLARFYTFENDPWRSSLVRPPTDERVLEESVEVAAGDELRKSRSLPSPVMIKIDVEGFEYSVIRGLRETLADPACLLVVCEIHPRLLPEGVQSQDVLNLLRSLGFGEVAVRASGTVEYAVGGKHAGFRRSGPAVETASASGIGSRGK
jgi:FkbM family methyltransferase